MSTHPVGPAFLPSNEAGEGVILRFAKLAGSSMTDLTSPSRLLSSSTEIPTLTLKWLKPWSMASLRVSGESQVRRTDLAVID